MTATWQPTLAPLAAQIRTARAHQLQARATWARSPNAQTIAAEQTATSELDALLDQLAATLR